MPIDWSPFVKLVEKTAKFVISSHVKPDCDALGSELGMAAVLRQLGKQVTILNADPVPPHLAFIDPLREIETLPAGGGDAVGPDCDAWIVLDTGAWSQLGPLAGLIQGASASKIVIDHHLSGDDLGAMVFKDTSAEATGTLVAEAAEALNVRLTPEAAEALFVAVATDTGWFRFSSVTGRTFARVAQLVDAGARPDRVYAQLYERSTLSRVLLRGRILASTAMDKDGRLAWCRATRDDFRLSGAESGDTEDVVNALLGIAGTELAALFVEQDPKTTRVSLRSRSEVDVRRVAEVFGGGGHAAAAGLTFGGALEEAESAVLDRLRQAMQRGIQHE